MSNTPRRWTLILGSLLVAILIAGFAAFQIGIRTLKGQIETALGPQGEVKEIQIGLTGVETVSYTHLDVYKRQTLASPDPYPRVRQPTHQRPALPPA